MLGFALRYVIDGKQVAEQIVSKETGKWKETHCGVSNVVEASIGFPFLVFACAAELNPVVISTCQCYFSWRSQNIETGKWIFW
ncbi:hypothetical protein BYT27DRAFT_7200452 [Phlegmacium glaucopus]|nr:hypothetical protein BYT27DRAFT_7200452 [Phlegmacium glaucopus]